MTTRAALPHGVPAQLAGPRLQAVFSLVVSDPAVAAARRFPLLCVVPLTTAPGEGALYPRLAPGRNGLRKPAHALVEQVRSVDKRRVRRVYGTIPDAALAAVEEGLRLHLGLG